MGKRGAIPVFCLPQIINSLTSAAGVILALNSTPALPAYAMQRHIDVYGGLGAGC